MIDHTSGDSLRAPPQYLCLHGRHSSVVLECSANEAPLWRYWGPRLADITMPPLPLRQTRPAAPASLEVDQPLSIAPTFGAGWFGRASLLAHRGGEQFSQQWQSCDIAADNNPQWVSVTLRDTIAGLRLIVTLRIDASSDGLTIQSCLHNEGKDILDVQWLAAATLPLPDDCRVVQSFGGEWAHEFLPDTQVLTRSGWFRENVRGRTSHDCFPGAIVLCEGATEHTGHVYGAHLGWSGNHTQTIEWQHDGKYQWQLGEWLAPGEARLAPGETLESPLVYAAFSPKGLNGLAQSFHAAVRAILPWPARSMPPRPVHLNTWEAVYFNHDEADLAALATSAAELGVERFVLDDGWFQGRDHDRAGLGDWWADARKFPDGLLPLAKHVVSRGMSFGLWVEPEMVNADSDLYRAHPDWTLQLEGRPLLLGRHQLVLDLARADVAEYLFTRLNILF